MDIKIWVQKQNALNVARRLLEDEYYKVTEKPNGTTLHLDIPAIAEAAGADSDTVIYAGKITGAPVGGLYPVELYDEVNGTLQGTGEAIPVMLHIGETLAVDTWIIVAASTVTGLTLS